MANTERPHDALFKAAFGTPAHAAGLFRSVLPRAVIDAIDWHALRGEPGELVEPDLSDRFSDLLFSARLRTGAQVLLYLLFEHQSERYPDMPLRMLGYEVRIWEAHRTRHPHDDRPPIIPVVLSHAPGGWAESTTFEARFALEPDELAAFGPLLPRFEVVLIDLAHLSNTDIKAMSLEGFQQLALWLMRDTRDGARLRESFPDWELALRLAHADAVATPHGLRAFSQLMRYVCLVAGDLRFQAFRGKVLEQVPDAEETLMTIAEELRAEGRAEGRTQERAQMLRTLIALKFGDLTPELAERISAATPEELQRYLERLLTAETAATVFAD